MCDSGAGHQVDALRASMAELSAWIAQKGRDRLFFWPTANGSVEIHVEQCKPVPRTEAHKLFLCNSPVI